MPHMHSLVVSPTQGSMSVRVPLGTGRAEQQGVHTYGPPLELFATQQAPNITTVDPTSDGLIDGDLAESQR